MRELIIAENDANQRVDKFLTKALPMLPKSLMYKYIRNKKIKVNRKRCEIAQRLQVGDTLQCYIAEEFFAHQKHNYDFLQVPKHLHILYEDQNILIAAKPVNLLVQKDRAGIQDTMNDRLLHYLYDQGTYDPAKEQSFTPVFVHRLDRNTEGILIAAKSAEALRIINEKLRCHEVMKYYLALVEGKMTKEQGELVFYHQKDAIHNQALLSDTPTPNSKAIHTSYRVIKTFDHDSLVEILLHTGKSHQIRASFAQIHHPLVGDQKYGAAKNKVFPYQALCAYKVCFAFRGKCGCLTSLTNREFIWENSRLQRAIETRGDAFFINNKSAKENDDES